MDALHLGNPAFAPQSNAGEHCHFLLRGVGGTAGMARTGGTGGEEGEEGQEGQ